MIWHSAFSVVIAAIAIPSVFASRSSRQSSPLDHLFRASELAATTVPDGVTFGDFLRNPWVTTALNIRAQFHPVSDSIHGFLDTLGRGYTHRKNVLELSASDIKKGVKTTQAIYDNMFHGHDPSFPSILATPSSHAENNNNIQKQGDMVSTYFVLGNDIQANVIQGILLLHDLLASDPQKYLKTFHVLNHIIVPASLAYTFFQHLPSSMHHRSWLESHLQHPIVSSQLPFQPTFGSSQAALVHAENARVIRQVFNAPYILAYIHPPTGIDWAEVAKIIMPMNVRDARLELFLVWAGLYGGPKTFSALAQLTLPRA